MQKPHIILYKNLNAKICGCRCFFSQRDACHFQHLWNDFPMYQEKGFGRKFITTVSFGMLCVFTDDKFESYHPDLFLGWL